MHGNRLPAKENYRLTPYIWSGTAIDRHFACRYRYNLSIAMLGTMGQSMACITRACVFVERYLASSDRSPRMLEELGDSCLTNAFSRS